MEATLMLLNSQVLPRHLPIAGLLAPTRPIPGRRKEQDIRMELA